MLTLYTRDGQALAVSAEAEAVELTPDVVWIDLLSPMPREVALVEEASGLRLPSHEDLSEIETSSRLRTDGDVLCLSAPLVHGAQAPHPGTTPVGFIVAPELLVTVRFEPLRAFDAFAQTARGSAPEMFVGLLDAIVDRSADVLEHIAADLDMLSQRLFRSRATGGGERRTRARENADLRAVLRRVGAHGDLTSKMRDSLLGLARIVPYVGGARGDAFPSGAKLRLDTLRQDIASLNDYDAHLLNRVQLLLDTTLGLINAEQNEIIKVLAVVAFVGVPPTLIASIYGMNFEYMPELKWAWGYFWGLGLMAFSAVAPVVWFKWRGWF